jgi:hypothetical protein
MPSIGRRQFLSGMVTTLGAAGLRYPIWALANASSSASPSLLLWELTTTQNRHPRPCGTKMRA